MKLQTYKCDNCQLLEVPTQWWKLLVNGQKNDYHEEITSYTVIKHPGKDCENNCIYEFDLCSENCLAKGESQIRAKILKTSNEQCVT